MSNNLHFDTYPLQFYQSLINNKGLKEQFKNFLDDREHSNGVMTSDITYQYQDVNTNEIVEENFEDRIDGILEQENFYCTTQIFQGLLNKVTSEAQKAYITTILEEIDSLKNDAENNSELYNLNGLVIAKLTELKNSINDKYLFSSQSTLIHYNLNQVGTFGYLYNQSTLNDLGELLIEIGLIDDVNVQTFKEIILTIDRTSITTSIHLNYSGRKLAFILHQLSSLFAYGFITNLSKSLYFKDSKGKPLNPNAIYTSMSKMKANGDELKYSNIKAQFNAFIDKHEKSKI